MKSPERQHKTATASIKRLAVTGFKRSKSRKSPNRAFKQRQKAAGEKEEEYVGLHLPSAIASLSPEVPSSILGQSSLCYQKFKIQLFPIDEVTRKGLEKEKHNPYLELTMGIRKKISSVVKHLEVKWGNSKVASGELMLFPYYARVENLANYISWTLKDCDTNVADVHSAIGGPALYRLRYGWFSNLEPKVGGVDLHNENTIVDEKMNSCPVVRCGPEPTAAPYNQDCGEQVLLEKSVEAEVNQRSGNTPVNIWDLSNISFGAFLSEASAHANVNAVTCDSFDAAIASLKSTNQSTSVTQSSIWDAEEACNAFSFRNITSSRKAISAQFNSTPQNSSTKNVSSSLLKLDNLDDACRGPMTELQLHTNYLACPRSLVGSQPVTTNVSEEPRLQLVTESTQSDSSQFRKMLVNWPDSMGPPEHVARSFKDIVGGDSIGLGALLANSLDAFQNVSIF